MSPSQFPHERAGLEILQDLLPATSPYRAWTNFEFMDSRGQWNEIDALILGRGRLHLVELKSYHGLLTGDENNWTRTFSGGGRRTERSPLILTRRKAQYLASRLKDEVRKVAIEHDLDPSKVQRAVPFVQESVFLHGDEFATRLSDLARSSLFGIPGREEQTQLPGIDTRILEPPKDGRQVNEDLSVIIGLAMRNIYGYRKPERDAGSWTIAGQPLAAGDDWQEFAAQHKVSKTKARARVVSLPPGTSTQAKLAAFRRLNREYALLTGLRHESILSPAELVQDESGSTVLVFPETPDYQPLDLYLAQHQLTADQQIDVLTQVAEALAYAHRNHVAHRGLTPGSVLVKTGDDGGVTVQLVDWSWAGRIHESTSGTMFGGTTGAQPAQTDVYQAPEDRWSPDADRIALDLFSLGALAYFLLSGGQAPARDRAELTERLRTEGGLDLAASGRFVDDDLRALVKKATAPSATQRTKPQAKGDPRFGAQEFAGGLAEHRRNARQAPVVDPLNPAQDDLIAERFLVQRVLGSGSTARGVLVKDEAANDAERVLKVGLDDTAAARLEGEAETLKVLGEQDPKISGVVELLDGPLELGSRTALLLSYCGEQTLAEQVRYDSVTEGRLKAWGTELLDTLIALDKAGITHRDIKPANLGLYRPDRRTGPRLVLFDFSLSREPATSIEAGTPPYRDPDLRAPLRASFDSAAERYSAAVVLYEMATATTPLYGDGTANPATIPDEPTIEVTDFTARDLPVARAEALTAFFRKALARDAKARFDTATAMREAWTAAFAATVGPSVPQVRPPQPKPVAAQTLEPEHGEPYTSLATVAAEFLKAAGTKPTTIRRQVVALLLGTHDHSPEDPFESYGRLAERLDVTPGRVSQIFMEFESLWAKNSRLIGTVDVVYGTVTRLLAGSGGVSTPELLARQLVSTFDEDPDATIERRALGILRLVLASQPSSGPDGDPTVTPVRRKSTGSIAMLTLSKSAGRLPAALSVAAEKLVIDAASDGRTLVGLTDATGPLREAAAKALGTTPEQVEVPTHVLLRIAAASSAEVALSARNELHRAKLAPEAALREVLDGASTSDTFTLDTLRSRVRARFPHAAPLPSRPGLDLLVAKARPGTQWNDEKGYFESEAKPDAFTHVPTHNTRTGAQIAAPLRSGSDLEVVLDTSIRARTFRAIGVPVGETDPVAAALATRFGAVHIDITEVLLGEMRARATAAGMPWDAIVAADSGASADREGLRGFVAQCVPAIAQRVADADAPVVLTDLSTLAAYGQLGVLQRWVELTTPPPHAVWALIPQKAETGGRRGALIDDSVLPQSAPEQFVQASDHDVDALIAAGVAASESKETSR
ncbi:protein kinase domain-containing protein [Tsukamurella soli]|uniref:protein kinase domain-containing protein n=1 Tax=Tsukamurella soli TaxID=644556 RepID=UPI0031F10DB3